MEKTIRFVLVLLAALVLIEAKSTKRHCSKVRGLRCSEDSECACLNRHNSTLICNFNYTCETRSFIDDIMRRQPCHRTYKSFCKVNADCPCNEARLICEDHECVKERRKPRKNKQINALIADIMRNQPCPGVFKKSCSTNADCPCSETPLMCEDNECVRDRPKQTIHRLRTRKRSSSPSRPRLLHELFKTARWLSK